MLVRPAQREYRSWTVDRLRRWSSYLPRAGDVVVATYPKCGTTWMQRIVSLLILQTAEPIPLTTISPWVERRFPDSIELVVETLDKQTHRRAVKTYLPFDGIPIFDEVKYIHVARDGRDACRSYHNHIFGFSEATLAAFDRQGLEVPSIWQTLSPCAFRSGSVLSRVAIGQRYARAKKTASHICLISISRTATGARGSAPTSSWCIMRTYSPIQEQRCSALRIFWRS